MANNAAEAAKNCTNMAMARTLADKIIDIFLNLQYNKL